MRWLDGITDSKDIAIKHCLNPLHLIEKALKKKKKQEGKKDKKTKKGGGGGASALLRIDFLPLLKE